MRITKVYTRGGDKGKTSLVGGTRVRKDHIRIDAYGTLDELNSILGLVRTFNGKSNSSKEVVDRIENMLHFVQNDLFNVGTELATPADQRWESMRRMKVSDIERLEGWIDELNEDLPPLKEFILPGGGYVGAFFHQARTVCRRAERITVALADSEAGLELPLGYLNRLSDFLFVTGRWAAQMHEEDEYLWDRTI